MNEPIEGEGIRLRPARPEDRDGVYEWAAESDLTAAMMGPPDFPDNPVPSREEFDADYGPWFFDGSRPEAGMGYVIEREGEAAGFVNYDGLGRGTGWAELDIWMRSSAHCGGGTGPAALRLLVRRLEKFRPGIRCVIRPSARNLRAVRAYEKAGFARISMEAGERERLWGKGDYEDEEVLIWPAEAAAEMECAGAVISPGGPTASNDGRPFHPPGFLRAKPPISGTPQRGVIP